MRKQLPEAIHPIDFVPNWTKVRIAMNLAYKGPRPLKS
jgi:hypothetical protein